MRQMDNFLMSLQAIRANKLRSSLTLFGIVLGVSSIIAVMTAISVVQSTMEQEMSILGAQTFQIQKWPSGFSSEEERLEAMRWPAVTLQEADGLREYSQNIDIVGSELWEFGFKAEYRDQEMEQVTICGGTPEYPQNNTHFVSFGRNISQLDIKAARRVVVIGHAIAQQLYPFVDPIGREIRVDGRNYEVVGVFDEKKSAFGGQFDSYVLMPVSTFVNTYGMTNREGFPRTVNITLHARSPEVVDDAIAEAKAILRRLRRLDHDAPDNFTLFNSESTIEEFNTMTAGIKVGAFIIGIIALVVAGIGIMNIMLVSVTERTREIGIRKSLGAKPRDILRQFLLEAVVLCNVGGVIGVLIGFAFGNAMIKRGMSPSFEAAVPAEWAAVGLLFCTVVGVAFGIVPAAKAARLNPVDALGYE
jgi:putative ABC transport system permease protein